MEMRMWPDDSLFFCFNNNKDGASFLSNFYPAKFVEEGVEFCNVEQYFQYKKMKLFGKAATAALILRESDPVRIKQLGRRGKGARMMEEELEVWKSNSMEVMRIAVAAKFDSNPVLQKRLLETEDKVLVERLNGRMTDKLWGVGKGNIGRNQLGVILMEYRSTLRAREGHPRLQGD